MHIWITINAQFMLCALIGQEWRCSKDAVAKAAVATLVAKALINVFV